MTWLHSVFASPYQKSFTCLNRIHCYFAVPSPSVKNASTLLIFCYFLEFSCLLTFGPAFSLDSVELVVLKLMFVTLFFSPFSLFMTSVRMLIELFPHLFCSSSAPQNVGLSSFLSCHLYLICLTAHTSLVFF